MLTAFHKIAGTITRALLFAVFACLASGAAVQAQPKKLALVVGNAAYQQVPGLQASARDAQDMASSLRGLDFEVTLLTDVGSEVFWVVLDTFAKQAQDAETVVFYYSGHAFQRGGINHLVPVGATLDNPAALAEQTWALNDIADRLKGGSSQLLIFLDACRTNPLPGTFPTDGDGLAQFDGGAGTFVAFATRPGMVAFDQEGASPNSPFTGALLASIATPGQSISDLMITVRNDVDRATAGKQTPWDQSSLRAQFRFVAEPATDAEAGLDELAGLEIDAESTQISAVGEIVLALATATAPTRQIVSRVMGDYVLPLPPVTSENRSLNGASVLTPVAGQPVVRLKGVDAGQPARPPVPEDLASAVQTELKRIGCYNQGIDGDWGRGSVTALERYYRAKKLTEKPTEEDAFQPTERIWRALLAEPEKTCEPLPVVARKPVVKKPASTTQKPAVAKQPAKQPAVAAPAKKEPTCKFLVVAIICN